MASVWRKRYNQSLFLAVKKGEYSASLIKGTAVREWVQVSVTGRDCEAWRDGPSSSPSWGMMLCP